MIIHLCQSVRGALTNWTPREWKKNAQFMTRDDGGKFDAYSLKQAFLDELAAGHEVIPIGECSNFDFKTGCKGHPDRDLVEVNVKKEQDALADRLQFGAGPRGLIRRRMEER